MNIEPRKGFEASAYARPLRRDKGRKYPSPQSFAVYDNGVSSNSAPPKGRGGESAFALRATARPDDASPTIRRQHGDRAPWLQGEKRRAEPRSPSAATAAGVLWALIDIAGKRWAIRRRQGYGATAPLYAAWGPPWLKLWRDNPRQTNPPSFLDFSNASA